MRKFRGVLLASIFPLSVGFHLPAAAQTQYEYDAAGRLVFVEHPSGWKVFYHYDSAGNRIKKLVSDANLPPMAVDDSIQPAACQMSYTFDPKFNDVDPEGGVLTITAKTDGTKGAVSIISNELRYDRNQPVVGGTDSFTYTIDDPEGASDTATVDVTMSEPEENVAPVANLDAGGQISPQGGIAVSVLNNDTDENCDSLTVTGASTSSQDITVQVVNGTQVQITHTGSTGFFPVPGSASYTISDGRGGVANGTITFSYWRNGF